MSGLGELGLNYSFATGVSQVSQRDLDQYDQVTVQNPVANFSWFGTASGTGGAAAMTLINALPDWPRNLAYSITGVANGTYGGTLTANFYDQFGVLTTEVVAIGTAVNGGTVYGTAICGKFVSGSFGGTIASSGTFVGTASIGLGTASNGSANSNWFGLLTKIAGTADVKNIVWGNNGTVTTLNKGTAIGTLVNTTSHSFQGTSGVAITDRYTVYLKPTFQNEGKGTMSAL